MLLNRKPVAFGGVVSKVAITEVAPPTSVLKRPDTPILLAQLLAVVWCHSAGAILIGQPCRAFSRPAEAIFFGFQDAFETWKQHPNRDLHLRLHLHLLFCTNPPRQEHRIALGISRCHQLCRIRR